MHVVLGLCLHCIGLIIHITCIAVVHSLAASSMLYRDSRDLYRNFLFGWPRNRLADKKLGTKISVEARNFKTKGWRYPHLPVVPSNMT